MCGINGFNFEDRKLIKKMNNSLKHRGPNDEGIFVKKNISLGHRRLSIIDLSERGHQPMEYAHKNKKVIIVYNGEIYNFNKIKKQLKDKGYNFRSNTDTEVILASYLEWGKDCVKKFNGMWAFCIYDLQKEIFFLSRDRLGQKPLYYYYNNKKFIFSSEIKGILNHNINLKINKEGMDLYLSMGFIPSPYSIYRNIYKLPSGQSMLFDLNKRNLQKEKYYNFPIYNPLNNKKKLMKEGKKLLFDATKLRMISDVPLGAFLSGGLDSSTITYYMKTLRDILSIFSVGFKGKQDETKYVNVMKNLLKTQSQHTYFYKKDYEKLLNKIFYYYDEPFADYSMFPTFFISKIASKKITVALTGDGGDEMFGGYRYYKDVAKLNLLKKIPASIRKLLLKKLPEISKLRKFKEGIRASILPSEKVWFQTRKRFYQPTIFKKISEKKMKEALKLAKGNLIEAFIIYDRHFRTLGDHFLCKIDRASMANSLEVRSPLLDHRIVEYSTRIPTKWKVNLFFTKILMREFAKNILPRKIIRPRKRGFSIPLELWIGNKKDKEIKKMVEMFFKKKIISKEWSDFYINKVLKTKDGYFNRYRTRMFLLNQWFNMWKDKIKIKKFKNPYGEKGVSKKIVEVLG